MATALGISPSFVPSELSALASPIQVVRDRSLIGDRLKDEESIDVVVITEWDVVLGDVTFTLVGVVQLLVWNMCLNSFHSITSVKFEDPNMQDILIAIYQTCNVVTQLSLIYFGGVRKNLFISAGVVMGILALAIALIVSLATKHVGSILIHLLMAPVGLTVGILMGCGFTFAAIFPVNFCGYLALGQGLGGVLSFGLWILFSKVAWNPTEMEGLKKSVWVMFSIAAVASWCSVALFVCTIRQKWAAVTVAQVLRRPRLVSGVDQEKTLQPYEQTGSMKGEIRANKSGAEMKPMEAGQQVNDMATRRPDEYRADGGPLKSSGRKRSTAQELEDQATASVGGSVKEEASKEGTGPPTRTGSRRQEEPAPIVLKVPSSLSQKRGSINGGSEASRPRRLSTSRRDTVRSKATIEETEVGWWTACNIAWMQLFNTGFTIWITLQMFPIIGPLQWTGADNDVIMGMFQIGDFVGRYVPNAAVIPYVGRAVTIPTGFLIVVVVARVVFVPLFMLSFKFKDTVVLNDTWYQVILMLVFSITNGWFVTQALIYGPDSVKHERDKGKVGLASSVVLILCIVIGLWMARLYKIGSY